MRWLAGAAAVACVLGACSPAAGPDGPERPNILLIVLDTVRADHVGAYGYPRETTPNLDALARQGGLFERAVSQAPWTAASVGSLLTGLYPSVHGLDSGPSWGETTEPGGPPFVVSRRLGEEHVTVAEILREGGYHTAAFVSNVYVNSVFGFDQGFDLYDDDHAEYSGDVHHVKRRAAETNRRVFAWLERAAEPFFLLVHYNDAHWPYDPPRPHGLEFVEGYEGRLEPGEIAWVVDRQGRPVRGLSDEDLRYVVGLYDGELHYVDAAIGSLREQIERRGFARPLFTLVTSDHGEELLDHGSGSHGFTLFDEMVRVPLVMHWPGRLAPRRVSPQVELLDVVPTLLDLLDLEPPARPVQGRSLVPLLAGQASLPPRAAYSEATFAYGHRGRLRALQTPAGLKLIERVGGPTAGMPAQAVLYDLVRDPGERTDLVAEQGERLAGLRAALAERVDRNHDLRAALAAPGEKTPLDDETLQRLRALGYLPNAALEDPTTAPD